MTLARWARTARSASAGRRSATAWAMARCSGSDTSGRPGRRASWNWCLTSCACSRSSSPTATVCPEITPTRRCSSRLSSEYLSGLPSATERLRFSASSRSCGGLVVGDPFRGLDRAQRLKGHPALGDRDGLFGGDDPDPGAAVGDPLDEPLGGQVEQRGPQGLPGHPERAGQLLLDQPLAGREVPAEDGLPQRRRGRARAPLPRPVDRLAFLLPCSDATYRRPRIVNNCPAALLTIHYGRRPGLVPAPAPPRRRRCAAAGSLAPRPAGLPPDRMIRRTTV